jgi:hypothetical protein
VGEEVQEADGKEVQEDVVVFSSTICLTRVAGEEISRRRLLRSGPDESRKAKESYVAISGGTEPNRNRNPEPALKAKKAAPRRGLLIRLPGE